MINLPRRRLILGAVATGSLASTGALAQPETKSEVQPPPAHVLGSDDAPVTVQEFFSYTCVHCAHFNDSAFPRVRAELIDTGKVRWIFRDFPLDGISLLVAALAKKVEASHYMAFQDMMLKRQQAWTTPTAQDPVHNLRMFAALSGISTEVFNDVAEHSDNPERREVIEELVWATRTFGIDSTPTFIMSRSGKPGFEKAYNMSADKFREWVEQPT